MQIQNYLNERVENQLNYFDTKSTLNKNYYHLFKVMQLSAAALLPFFSVFITDFGWTKYIVALLGTMVTILEGVLSTGRYHEKWVTYRTTAEMIRQEKFLFLMKAGDYDRPGAYQQFVSKIELLLAKESAGWQQMILKEKDNKSGQADNNGQSDPVEATTANGVSATPANGEALSAPIDPLTGVAGDNEAVREQ